MKTHHLVALTAIGLVAGACAPSGFTDQALVQSVRVLGTVADPPYAKPGATVNLTVLAYDGRPSQPEPMTITWIPYVCENPPEDAYYGCFAKLAKGGFSAGLLGSSTGPSFRFTMPADAVSSHTAVPGTPVPYGVAYVFNIACAGHVQLVPIDANNINPQTVPLGCFDAQGNQLGPNDYVFGFTRVYAYDTLTNSNPVIDHVDVNGQALAVMQDSDGQLTTLPVSTTPCNARGCEAMHIGPVVPASSQEVDPEETDPNGNPVKEEIWADFFSTFGSVKDDARLLYDSIGGSVGDPSETDEQFTPPVTSGTGYLWAVVHDNRGGASWVTIPVNVQ